MTSEKKPKKPRKPYNLEEGRLSSFTKAALAVSGLEHFRFHLGGLPKFVGKKIVLTPNPMKGFPDWIIITKSGVLSPLELKSENGKLSDKQVGWKFRLIATNCNYCKADTEDEVLDYIEKLGGWTGRAVFIKQKP